MKRSKTLAGCLTRSGNTRVIAKTLRRKLGANLCETRPARPYPADYEQRVAQAQRNATTATSRRSPPGSTPSPARSAKSKDTRMIRAIVVATALAASASAQADPRPSIAPRNMQAIAPALAGYTDDVLFGDVWLRPDLSPRDRSLVTIAALAAGGDDDQLAFHIQRGLDNGLIRTEIVEAFTHLAFYAGWPKASARSRSVIWLDPVRR